MPDRPTNESASRIGLVAAFAAVYFIWGSTYLAIRFAIDTLPPFLMSGVRFCLAGLILYAVMQSRTRVRLGWTNWRGAFIGGSLMLMGPGLVSWAEQLVPSGLTALIIATIPLWLVSLDRWLFGGPRLNRAIVAGLLIGLVGVAVLLGPDQLGGAGVNPLGGAVLLLACGFWSFGSLYSRGAQLPKSPFLATAMQMAAGGAGLVLVGTLAGEWSRVNPSAVSLKSVLSVAYLVVFGSILALTAYTYLLRATSAARVATYAYVNPVVAMVLGCLFAGEPVSSRVLVAAGVILGAVVLINTSRAKPEGLPAQDEPEAESARIPRTRVDWPRACSEKGA